MPDAAVTIGETRGLGATYSHQGETYARNLLQAAADGLGGVVAQATPGEDVAITRDGRRGDVLVSWATWERVSRATSFGALLTSSPLEEGDITPGIAARHTALSYRDL